VNESPEPPESDESRRDAEDDFWQWVAVVVLLACWLAEAQM
jgi:hypothetical protein